MRPLAASRANLFAWLAIFEIIQRRFGRAAYLPLSRPPIFETGAATAISYQISQK